LREVGMRKVLLAALAAFALSLGGAATAGAQDENQFVADPDQRAESEEARCQELGDDNSAENDDRGLQTAVDTVVSVIETFANREDQNEDCDNSDGRRP